jgi:predicted nucleotidyltransferase
VINTDIIVIKYSIPKTVGENCKKIILFGSYASGTPRDGSDYDGTGSLLVRLVH